MVAQSFCLKLSGGLALPAIAFFFAFLAASTSGSNSVAFGLDRADDDLAVFTKRITRRALALGAFRWRLGCRGGRRLGEHGEDNG